MFDIPYEALTGSNDLQQFIILTQSAVSMATLRRALNKELSTLRFRECHFNVETYLYTPTKCMGLVDLCFADCVNLPGKLVASIIEYCPNLQRLNLWNVSAVSDSIFITVALHLPQLKVLYARCDQVTDVGILAIARACFKLQDVIVTNTTTDGALYPTVVCWSWYKTAPVSRRSGWIRCVVFPLRCFVQ
jgi:hypothetical protein